MSEERYDPSEWGIDPDQSWRVVNSSLFREWAAEHPEWGDVIDGHAISYESAIIADSHGVPTPDQWTDMQIAGDESNEWTITIYDDEGNAYRLDMGENYDLAWDFYDCAGYYDVERDKDIDTGGTDQ